jgi:hypothetical protein
MGESSTSNNNSIIKTPEFSEALFTTRTVIFDFKNDIDLIAIAKTLPLEMIHFSKPWKRNTKPKLKEFPPLGTIFSIRMINLIRGVFGVYFKNSLMVDMSLGTKSVNVKISKHTIHICGIKETKHGEYVANTLVNYISKCNDTLILIEKYQKEIHNLFEWIKQGKQGDLVTRETFIIERTKIKDKHKLKKKVTGEETLPKYIPFNVDEAFANFNNIPVELILFFSKRFSECQTYTDMMKDLDYFNTNFNKRCILDNTPSPIVFQQKVQNVMVNCSYSFGFPIKKSELTRLINETQSEFIASYNKVSDHSVNVFLLSSEKEREDFGDRDQTVAHTFIVYESSYCMMSSKFMSGMKDAFYKFRDLIEQLRPNIIDTSKTT